MPMKVLDLGRAAKDNTLTRALFPADLLSGSNLNLTGGANNATITGLANPTAANDAANKAYVDASLAALARQQIKAVHTISTANLPLTGIGQTINGRVIAAGDRVFAAGQTTTTQDGVYVAASGAWARSTDDTDAVGKDIGGFSFIVMAGTYADQIWVVTNDAGSGVVGTANLTIASAAAAYTPPTIIRAENLTVTNGSPNLTLANTPDSTGVTLNINGVTYRENAGFTRTGTAITVDVNMVTGDIAFASYQY